MKITNAAIDLTSRQSTPTTKIVKGFESALANTQGKAEQVYSFKDIAARYDLRNISSNEVQQLGGELYRAGFLNEEEAFAFARAALPVPDGLPGIREDDRVDRLSLVNRDLDYAKRYQSSDLNTVTSLEKTKSVYDKVLSLINSIDLRA